MATATMPQTAKRRPKRAQENESIQPTEPLAPAEAIATLRKFKAPKFDQTVEVCLHLNIDPKQADQAIRGSVAMPKGIGKTKRVVAFCPPDAAKQALEAGAVKAGGEELVNEVQSGFLDFDVAVASPDMMRLVSRLGKTLGPKGLMPSPKSGTVTQDVPTAVREYAAGKVEYRNDKGGNVHAAVGKMSFSDEDLTANLTHFVHTIQQQRPSSVKGGFIKKVTVKGAMTPSVLVKPETIE